MSTLRTFSCWHVGSHSLSSYKELKLFMWVSYESWWAKRVKGELEYFVYFYIFFHPAQPSRCNMWISSVICNPLSRGSEQHGETPDWVLWQHGFLLWFTYSLVWLSLRGYGCMLMTEDLGEQTINSYSPWKSTYGRSQTRMSTNRIRSEPAIPILHKLASESVFSCFSSWNRTHAH